MSPTSSSAQPESGPPTQAGPRPDGLERRRSVRLFFALWPDPATVRALTDWAAHAHARCGGRIMRPDTLHLTLGFLGETTPELLPRLARETETRRIEPGAVVLDRFGAFPRPRIVWAGPGNSDDAAADDGAARLALEHRRLWEWVAPLHPARPETRFRPHVTLLRNADTSVLPDVTPPPLEWRYDRYVLVASVQDGAARYRVVASTRA